MSKNEVKGKWVKVNDLNDLKEGDLVKYWDSPEYKNGENDNDQRIVLKIIRGYQKILSVESYMPLPNGGYQFRSDLIKDTWKHLYVFVPETDSEQCDCCKQDEGNKTNVIMISKINDFWHYKVGFKSGKKISWLMSEHGYSRRSDCVRAFNKVSHNFFNHSCKCSK